MSKYGLYGPQKQFQPEHKVLIFGIYKENIVMY